MNRLTCNGWTWSQMIEEWNYRYEERLGMLCEDLEPAPWMVKMATEEADAAIEKLVQKQQTLL